MITNVTTPVIDKFFFYAKIAEKRGKEGHEEQIYYREGTLPDRSVVQKRMYSKRDSDIIG